MDRQPAAPTDVATDPPAPPPRRRRTYAFLVLGTVAAALVIKSFLVQVAVVPSGSMEPTLTPGDRILVCRLCTTLGGIQRGDVVVFHDPARPATGPLGAAWEWLVEGVGVGASSHRDIVKRVVALPGEVVEIRDATVYVDGVPLDEPYVAPDRDTRPFGPVAVPAGTLFVLGDDRLRSGDSRFAPPAGVGMVPEDDVIGEVVGRVWPPSRIGGLA
ncbi:MAG TPA: signal peptidase I [Actinomycetota bacterium]|nr:signal peptidase I [Actinomycetota bacterium]